MSRIWASPPGTKRLAKRSPTPNVTWSAAADASPIATSRGRIRTARAAGLATSASEPRARPVHVIRCQNRSRGPRNVAAKAVWAASRPASRAPGMTRVDAPRGTEAARSATDETRQHEPEHEQRSEGEVQPRRLEV